VVGSIVQRPDKIQSLPDSIHRSCPHAATRDAVKRGMNQLKAYKNGDRRIRKVLRT
jgi:hypothetical protein